jgi:hypothetical protein
MNTKQDIKTKARDNPMAEDFFSRYLAMPIPSTQGPVSE